MGLGFTHISRSEVERGASWAYSGFMRFRTRLAEQIGINLKEMEMFGGTKSWKDIIDPIKPFLAHSDCDGILTPEECAMIAPRLRQLVEGYEDYDYDKQQALELAKTMDICAEKKENLEFC